jgi:hypothetical protein
LSTVISFLPRAFGIVPPMLALDRRILPPLPTPRKDQPAPLPCLEEKVMARKKLCRSVPFP